MTSERKAAANRRNAKGSTGPRTEAGKLRSSQNAWRHGLAVRGPRTSKAQDDIGEIASAICRTSIGTVEITIARKAAECRLLKKRIDSVRLLILERIGLGTAALPNHAPCHPFRRRLPHITVSQGMEQLIRLERYCRSASLQFNRALKSADEKKS